MYDINNFFIYKIIVLVEILIAQFMFLKGMKKRSRFLIRVTCIHILLIGLTMAIPVFSYEARYISLLFIFIYLLTVIGQFFIYDVKWLVLFYLTSAGYITQHLSYAIVQIIMIMSGLDVSSAIGMYGDEAALQMDYFSLAINIEVFFIVYLLTYGFFASKIKEVDFYIDKKRIFFLCGFFAFSAIVLNSFVVNSKGAKENAEYVLISSLYSFCISFLTLLFYYQLISAKKAEHQRDMIKKMWQDDKEHYKIAKENIDIINTKCHDLKHQIRKIRQGNSLDNNYVKEIENSIMIYDSVLKTGNDALDVVLAEKSFICNKQQISLTGIIDGEKLCFIEESDIYALFGNAIDNAIEYLIKIENHSDRFIRIQSKETNGLFIIRIENYLKEPVELKDGLPVTTKEDKNLHGFGMKSMKMIVESYGGELFINQENNLFSINMTFQNKPLTKEK